MSQAGNAQNRGMIFDIERFATHDGPGIRTVVFFKGCSLRCLWCANPESQSSRPEVIFIPRACSGCGACIRACPRDAIRREGAMGPVSVAERCAGCGQCVDACVYGARKPAGERMDVDAVMEEILRDREYYRQSGGGVTFSGGEPLLQADFCEALGRALAAEGISLLLETCGMVLWEAFEAVMPYLDTVYYDIKHMDAGRHKEITGADNQTIIRNLNRLSELFAGEIKVRYPYIPGYNDDTAAIRSFLQWMAKLRINGVEFLPYHRLGWPKYTGLGREYALKDIPPLKKSDLAHLIPLGDAYGVSVEIGG